MTGYPQNWENQLATGLKQLGLEITQTQQNKLLDYLALLKKWNKTYNLTAIRDPDEMVSRQLLDSLSILSLVEGERILDVGTGAGLPGIPLAICMPQASFTLIDSNGKKTRFVQQAKLELGLNNLQVQQTRIENLETKQGFDTITSRAFADLPKIVELTARLLSKHGVLLAMKGAIPRQELEILTSNSFDIDIVKLNLPATEERHAILIRAGN